MLQLTVSILGYTSQFFQILGLRIYLLTGFIFLGLYSIFAIDQALYANAIFRGAMAFLCFVGFFRWNTVQYKFKPKHLFYYLLCSACVYFILVIFTKDPFPILDTITASGGIIGMYLGSVRSILLWPLTICMNCLEAIMFYLNGSYQISIMHVVFAISCVIGFYVWKYREIDKTYSSH